MVRNKCDLKTHFQNLGYLHTLKIKTQKTSYFRRLQNVMVNLAAYIIWTKQHIDNRGTALETAKGPL